MVWLAAAAAAGCRRRPLMIVGLALLAACLGEAERRARLTRTRTSA
jgi:hypothetical protein